MVWSLYKNNEFLPPLVFSNGKSQSDVVDEVLDAIKTGSKIIFIHGMCGTGKSAIALNIARKLGKTSIVVPIKNLQNQYKKDYEEEMYVLRDKPEVLKDIDTKTFPQLTKLAKNSAEKLKISIMTGRKNHKCRFLEENKNAIPRFKKETNASLNIFDKKREAIRNLIANDTSCDNYNLPCKIEIKEKNWNKLREYLRQNQKIDHTKLNEIRDVKRVSVATICPYWSPVLEDQFELKILEDCKKRKYTGLRDLNFIFHQAKPGCGFYEQFNSYIDSDVIVFNSLKYKLESALLRKPLTEVEIIDECDEFLDSFSNTMSLNVDKFLSSLGYVSANSERIEKIIKEILEILRQVKRDKRINEAANSGAIIPLRETGIFDLFKILLKNPAILDEVDSENYLFNVYESAKIFEEFFNDTYLTAIKKDERLLLSLVTTNLEKKFKEMTDKNKIIVLMSGTLHSSQVLKNIFGLSEYKIIEAETQKLGRIDIVKTGMEIDCKYSNFSGGKYSRGDYLKALSKCVEIAKKPVLVHVNAFADLPGNDELENFGISNLISKEKLIEFQNEDKTGELVHQFKTGKTDVLFSTRCARGVDFPGEQCSSIIFTKYPNPNVQDAFWKILAKTKPQHYWDFYRDKASRELLQKIYRGLRSKNDHIYLLSPDSRVLDGARGI